MNTNIFLITIWHILITDGRMVAKKDLRPLAKHLQLMNFAILGSLKVSCLHVYFLYIIGFQKFWVYAFHYDVKSTIAF